MPDNAMSPETGMAQVLDSWADDGLISQWDGLKFTTRKDGSVLVTFNLQPPFDVGFLQGRLGSAESIKVEKIRQIDLDTLRRNPNAGRNTYLHPGQTQELSDGSTHRDFQIVHSLQPEGPWLYGFEPLQVTCSGCGASFDVKDLKADYYPGEQDEVYSNEVCPHCHQFDCLEFPVHCETVEEGLERAKKSGLKRFIERDGVEND